DAQNRHDYVLVSSGDCLGADLIGLGCALKLRAQVPQGVRKALAAVGIHEMDRVVAHEREHVRPFPNAFGIRTRPSAQPGSVVPSTVIVEAILLVSFLHGVAVALWQLSLEAHCLIRRASERKIFLIAND